MKNLTKQQSRKLILYIASSLDGYIAGTNDDLSFLSTVQTDGEDYGYSIFIRSIDTVIMGRKTFDWVTKEISGLPHPDKETYIITRTEKPSIGKTKFYNGNLKDLVLRLKSEKGKNIFCDGGAEIVNELLNYHLIDEFVISVIPILLGNGIKLYMDGRPEQKLKLLSVKSFESGLVQFHYKCYNEL